MSCRELEFGFIEPGHGLKGKKQWITSDEDIIMIETVEKIAVGFRGQYYCVCSNGLEINSRSVLFQDFL